LQFTAIILPRDAEFGKTGSRGISDKPHNVLYHLSPLWFYPLFSVYKL